MPQLDQMSFFSQVFWFFLFFYSLYFIITSYFLPIIFYILKFRVKKFDLLILQITRLSNKFKTTNIFHIVIVDNFFRVMYKKINKEQVFLLDFLNKYQTFLLANRSEIRSFHKIYYNLVKNIFKKKSIYN